MASILNINSHINTHTTQICAQLRSMLQASIDEGMVTRYIMRNKYIPCLQAQRPPLIMPTPT